MRLWRKIEPNSYIRRLTLLKKLFWLYFFLLIFEGALRKWVAPQLSAPLLIIRDPVGMWIIWQAYRTHRWPHRWTLPLTALTVLIVSLFVVQIIAGGNPLLVGLFGLRSYLLPFPVMFVMGENLDQEDLRRMGICTLWFLILNTPIAVAQYLAPGNAFLNKGAYEGAGQIGYIGEHMRSSGTFSFAVGLVFLAGLAAAFLIYGMVNENLAKKRLLWASIFALLLLTPTTGARSLLAQFAAILGSVAIGAMMGISQFTKVLKIIIPIAAMGLLVSFVPVFSQAMSSMVERITGATLAEGGTVQASVYDRTLAPMVNTVGNAVSSSNWIGIGLGRGSVAVQMFLNGTNEMVAGEAEIEHEVGEMGLPAAVAFELFKLAVLIALLGGALARAREGEPLALLLFPLVVSFSLFGLFEQPTVQGFIVITSAFCIAAGKMQPQTVVQRVPLAYQRLQMMQQRRVQRGPAPNL